MKVSIAPVARARVSENVLVVAALLIFAAAFLQFFGSAISSGLRLLPGDTGDASLIALLHEHVFRAIRGQASFLNPPFYFPTRGVLGYTDAFLLNQFLYAPLRFAGAAPLLAIQLTFMLLSLVGATFFTVLLVRFFHVRLWVAIIAAAIFAYAHNLYLKTIHPQHFAIYYLPVLSYFFFTSLFAAHSVLAIAACAFGAGLLLGLSFLTGYYMSWFFAFFLMFAVPLFFWLRRRQIITFARANRTRLVAVLAGAGAGFCLGGVGVVLVYLPAIKVLQGLTVQNFLTYSATARDLINVSDSNLVWGWLLRRVQIVAPHRLGLTEAHLAVTPLLVAFTATGVWLAARAARKSDCDRLVAAIGAAILFGFVMLYAFTISIRGEWSAFLLLQRIIPGALGIRVGFRSQVISGMFVCIALALVAEAYLRRSAPKFSPGSISTQTRSLIVLAIGVLLVLEQINIRSTSLFDRSKEEAWLASVPSPPAQCRAFAYYNDGSRSPQAIQVDAMRISQKFKLPTVNGYSGGVPIGWNLGNVWDPAYLDRVKQWSRDKGIDEPLCYYTEPTKTWSFIDLRS